MTADENIIQKDLSGAVQTNVVGLDANSNYNTIDYGLVIGGGVNTAIEGYWLNVTTRYYYGLADITKETMTNQRNGTFTLSVTFSTSF